MIRRWTLKRNLVVMNVLLLTVAILYSSNMLIRYSGEVSLRNLINSSYDMLGYACRSIDDYITSEVKISTEVIQNDSGLKEHIEKRPEEYKSERDKLIDVYMLNRYFNLKNVYSRVSESLVGIINQNGVVYNLKYPMDQQQETEDFSRNKLSEQNHLDYSYHWYPLQKNCFIPETGNIRKDLAVPVMKNLLLDGTGYQGTLIYSLSEESIYEQYKNSKLLEEGYIYIVDQEGNLISHSNEDCLLNTESIKAEDYTQKSLVGKEYYFISNQKVVMSQILNGGDWLAIAVIPLNQMINEIVNIYKKFVLVITVILIVSISVSVFLSKQAIKPLETMIGSMERVENGDFSVRVPEQGPSDIAKLLHHYNTMLENAQQYIREEYQIKRMKKAAELDALVAQINPHFLYNTLESIVWQARSAGIYKVSDMAYSLGKMFNIMVNKGHSRLSVEQELEHVKLYVHLQNIRYGERFCLKIDLDDEELLKYQTLKLILQPIVENIILHGFPRNQTDCVIHIGVYVSHGMLVYDVEDNGIGIPSEELEQIRKGFEEQDVVEYDEQNAKRRSNDGRGIGLMNVHQRIALYYGKQYGLKIFSEEGEGTEVLIYIPVKKS